MRATAPTTMTPDIKRIAVYGPESTGKTALATRLAAHFAAPLVAEYARERWDAQGALTLEDMLPVAKEQWRREDAAAVRADRLVICDTDALTTMLWSDLLYGTTPAFLEYFGLKSLDDMPASDELRRIPVTKPESLLTVDSGLATTPPEQLSLAEATGENAAPEVAGKNRLTEQEASSEAQ